MTRIKSAYYFIVNPRAGSGKTMCQWIPAERKLDKLGVPYITALTDHKKHATQLAYDAAEEGYRKIIAVGGDGSLHETYSGICKWCFRNQVSPSEFYLGVIPIGSGNDWIKSIKVPHDIDQVVDILYKDSYQKMDVVTVKSCGGKYSAMANIAGVGFDSHVCQRVNKQKESGRRGKLIYLNALRFCMLNTKAINICLVCDGEVAYTGPCYSIAFGNGKYSGSGMRQVPLAKIDDGLVDFTIIPKVSVLRIAREIPRLFKGTLHECDLVITGRGKSIQVVPMDESSNDIIEIDGEIEGRLPISIEATSHQINVMKRLNSQSSDNKSSK